MLSKELESTAEEVKDTLKTAKDGDSKITEPTVKDLKDTLAKAKDVDSKESPPKKDGHTDWSLSRDDGVPYGFGLGLAHTGSCPPTKG